MAVDPFDDDPIAEAEIVPAEWKRQARAARQSLQRAQRRQAAELRAGAPSENLGELWPAADPGGGAGQQQAGISGATEVLQNILEQAQQIRELLQTISEKLPSVGTYGP